MNEGAASGAAPVSHPRLSRRWIPFWALQAAEVAVGLVFADISIHVANGGFLVVAGVADAGLAITAKGPLGIFRLCGQRLHMVLAMVVSTVIALAPLVPVLRPDIQGIIVLEFGAVGVFRLATLTRTDGLRGTGRPAGMGAAGPVIDTTATPTVAGADARRPTPDAGPAAGPADGPADGTVPTPAPTPAARRAGQVGGAAVASGRRAAARYGPEAEAQVKSTIRGIGRLAGKVSAKLAPPEDAD